MALADEIFRPSESPVAEPAVVSYPDNKTTTTNGSNGHADPSIIGLAPLPSFLSKSSKPITSYHRMDGLLHETTNDHTKPPAPPSEHSPYHLPSVPLSFLPSLIHSGPLLPSAPSLHTVPDRPKVVQVQCKARTRVPTPHGPVFLHIYHNNQDSKEHLAIVIDPAQLDEDAPPQPFIRSRSLDAQWHKDETDMERLIRGAYVGRLSPTKATPSKAPALSCLDPPLNESSSSNSNLPTPIVRIHSECYTGETIGSMRCDCGEQLDEAIRFISQPQHSHSTHPEHSTKISPGRGAVIYMRQEGRGIGLLEKIRAYNLQDMGHDTVSANLLLGHGADERGYEIAAAIMRDLGLADEIRLLTNNPEKMEALRVEGVKIKERLPMVPRSWTDHAAQSHSASSSDAAGTNSKTRKAGATMIGGGAAHGVDLERYLRTKVQRMGHLLELPTSANPQPDQEIVIPQGPQPEPSAFSELSSSPVINTTSLHPRDSGSL